MYFKGNLCYISECFLVPLSLEVQSAMATHKVNLEYEFRYNASEKKKIELRYSCAGGAFTGVFTLDSAAKAQEVMQKAEALFSKELGRNLERTIEVLFHTVLIRCGVWRFRKNTGPMAEYLAGKVEQDLKQQLMVKKGPIMGSTWSQSHRRFTPERFTAELDEAIYHLDKNGKYPSRSLSAKRMDLGSAKTLDRYREHFEDKCPWRERVRRVSRK